MQGGKSGQDLARTGPTVLNARVNPSTIELNRNMQPSQAPEILAEVKDFNSKITEVKLRFIHAPMEISMQNVGGTTWKATLSPEQVKALAVGGQTMRYEANIIARNEDGDMSVSSDPVEVAVKTPDMGSQATG